MKDVQNSQLKTAYKAQKTDPNCDTTVSSDFNGMYYRQVLKNGDVVSIRYKLKTKEQDLDKLMADSIAFGDMANDFLTDIKCSKEFGEKNENNKF